MITLKQKGGGKMALLQRLHRNSNSETWDYNQCDVWLKSRLDSTAELHVGSQRHLTCVWFSWHIYGKFNNENSTKKTNTLAHSLSLHMNKHSHGCKHGFRLVMFTCWQHTRGGDTSPWHTQSLNACLHNFLPKCAPTVHMTRAVSPQQPSLSHNNQFVITYA